MAAPNSAERKACWAARDALWSCLDLHPQHHPKEAPPQHQDQGPQHQVRYFAKRREYLKFKSKMQEEGFTPAEGSQQTS
ncbi:hypothetical protein CRUP_037156 [Coryphaenoides rupestris]|nr:hypothetical protein CRUP_037156 [Coryphaenoides rupestris]